MADHNYTVYLLANSRHGTLYVGITSDLLKRIGQHRDGTFGGFTAKYGVHRLVWYEAHSSVVAAIAREKRIKNWKREWKINLIEVANPAWDDLALAFGFDVLPSVGRPFRNTDT